MNRTVNTRMTAERTRVVRPPRSVKLGRTKLTVIGPGKAHLEALREEWRDWLATMKPDGAGPHNAVGSLVQAAQIIDKTDPSKVTPPNHASITLVTRAARSPHAGHANLMASM